MTSERKEKMRGYQATYRAKYPERIKIASRKWREANRGYFKDWSKHKQHFANIKKKFGVTKGQYETMLLAQNGLCAICGIKPNHKKLSVDHDHVTGRIRGLLCSPCNLGLGSFRDNIESLARAQIYLRANLT